MTFLKKFPNFTVIISCFFWGTYWIPLRYINENNDNSVWPIAISFILLSLILIKSLIKSFNQIIYNNNYFFLLGCLFAASGIALYSESLLRGEIAKVVVLFYLAPVWGTIFAKIFLKQTLSLNRIISIILGIVGLEIMISFEKGIFLPSSIVEFIAIFAGLSWALGMTFFHLAKSTTSSEKTSLTSLNIFIIFLLLSFIPEGRNFIFPSSLISLDIIYIWIFLFALIWLLPSILLTYFSVEVLDPGRINILLAFEVVVGFLSAAILTNEIIGYRELLGGLFVISACFVDVFFIKFNLKK
ncbi:MAG: hypothetical protein CFH16_01185 [Alphaproteobacteria bacterium MarineAlpha5_Bin6]|nr:MAG: hypothetical protein CFH16_01185 [Alphaproteobacteria bacterium MarineAlpha5_Bin6]|tara:strand:+ start:422 stop:1318 length:897 start_codon:yes stop_codon:yes gene_type:complete